MTTENAPTTGQMLREDAPLLLLWALAGLATLVAYPNLPTEIPIHWNWRGEADGWAPKVWGAALMPATVLLTYAVTVVAIRLDPRGDNHARTPQTLQLFRVATPVFLIAVHLTMLALWLGATVDVVGLVFAGTGALFAVLGNVMGRLQPNYFIGIRVPWTLESDVVWKKTHRLAGALWFVGGIALMLSLWLPPGPRLAYFLALTLALAVTPVVAAYGFYRQEA